MSGLDEKGLIEPCGGCGEAGAVTLCSDCPPVGYPTDKTRCLPCPRRASTTPADVGEEPVAWRMRCVNPRLAKQPGYWVLLERKPTSVQAQTSSYEIEPLYSATALERVVRERDEARAAVAYEAGDPDAFKYHKALFDKLHSAEAKLAEARKVIADLLACPAIADGSHSEPAWADHETIEAERAARRFLEETK